MADYERGTMEIGEQSRTFSNFMRLSIWFGGLTALTVLFLSLTFAAGTSWMVALLITVIVGLAVGVALDRRARWYATVIGLAVVIFLSAVTANLVGMLL
ncbi:aa3-type cytochrome c oxidase subunit IV [Hyphobacterium sp.]|uniref:aa3-type cytochrome c oxidase subunit IV n=1 Tax=Hyphobacterium sp. TaxID=2004662 RepID=UPI003BAA9639